MENKNLKVNAISVMLLRLLNIAFPLITGPYIARILDKTDYGYFNIANAFVNLLIPFATLGIYNYGIREISNVKHQPDKVNRMFSRLFYISVVGSIATTAFFIFYVETAQLNSLLKTLYYIVGIQILMQFLYIEWLNEALEEFTFLLYKTLIIRVMMLVAIFIFVHQEKDIIPYAIVLTVINILNYILNFVWIKKRVKLVRVTFKEIKQLIWPLIALFLMINANMLYTQLDKLFLGSAKSPVYVSYYTLAQGLIQAIAGVITGTVSVSLPRLSHYLGIGDYQAYKNLVNKGSRLFNFFMIPIGMGIAILGSYAMLIYAGEKYIDAGMTTTIFGIRSIFVMVETILGMQIIFVHGYENKMVRYLFVGGIINAFLNTLLYVNHVYLPEYYILTTLLSETVVLLLYTIFIVQSQLISLKNIFKNILSYLIYTLGFIPIYIAVVVIHPVPLVVSLPLLQNVLWIIGLCVVYYVIVLVLVKDTIFLELIHGVREFVRKKYARKN